MKHQKLLIRIGAILLASIVVTWLALILWLPGMVKQAVHDYGQSIGYDIHYGQIKVSPWVLKLDIHDLSLAPAQKDESKKRKNQATTLLEIKHLSINAEFIHLAIGRVHLSEVKLDGVKVHLLRQAQQQGPQWNVVQLIQALQKKNKAKESPSTLKLEVGDFQLSHGYLLVQDEVQKTQYEFKQVSFSAKDFANYAQTGARGVQSDYDLRLNNIDMAIPGSANRLKLSKLGLGGHIDLSTQDKLTAKILLSIEESSIQSQLNYDFKQSDLTGQIQLSQVPLAPFISLLPTNQALKTQEGTVSAQLQVKTNKKGWAVLGDLDFSRLVIVESLSKEPLLSWDKAYFSKFELDFLEKNQQRFSIQELAVTKPVLRFIIGEDKYSNFRRLFMKNLSDQKASTVAADQSVTNEEQSIKRNAQKTIQKDSEKPKFEVDIKAVKLHRGSMYFSDLSLKPRFQTRIRNLNGSLLGVSNVPGQYATIALDGTVDRRGSMRARGQAAFEDPRRNSDVSITFRNLPLESINPYSMTFAGHRIDDGRIDVDFRYTAKEGQLIGKNHFLIRKIKLGEEVQDFKGTRLPIGLAIAVLEDSDGLIDVNIPIKGNVDSPEFSLGHLFWQALRNVLSSIVTAPFRALASLLGEEGLDGVYAAAGESVITPPEREKLEKVATLLLKRDKARLEFYGTYDPQLDRQELARVNADRAILIAAGFKLKEDEPLPNPSLADPRIQSGLKSAYGSQVGRIKLMQQLIQLPNNPQRWETLRKELIQAQNISDAKLVALANARAKNAQDVFLKKAPDMKNRVQMGQVQVVKSDSAGVPVGISLITQ